MGISMEMGTIHAGDFLVSLLFFLLCISQSSQVFSWYVHPISFGPLTCKNLLMVLLLQRRFCSHLNMENNEVRAATETVKKSEMLDIRLVPSSFYIYGHVRVYRSSIHFLLYLRVLPKGFQYWRRLYICLWVTAGRVLYQLLQLPFTWFHSSMKRRRRL